MRNRIRLLTAATLLSALFTSSAYAAEFTDLADAADDKDDLVDETYDPFDFHIEPSFIIDLATARITREAACVPNDSDLVGQASQEYEAGSPRLEVNRERCAEPKTVDNDEMDYRNQTLKLDIALRAGLYKDLELHLHIPYVISDVHGFKYATDVNDGNSSVDPSDDRIQRDAESVFAGSNDVVDDLDLFSTYRFMDLSSDFQDFERSGFADPTLGVHWAPFNDERDDTKATLTVGMDYLMPIAPIKRHDNSGVGRGVHELQWTIASSKKFQWIEPYFGLQYFLPIPSSDSEFRRIDVNNDGQVFLQPPQKGLITIGTEFIPHEDPTDGSRYSIDLQFQFAYTSEGLDYTPLFDPLSSSSCNGKTLDELLPTYDASGNLTDIGDVECAWIARQPSNGPPVGGEPSPIYDLGAVGANENPDFEFDGIMTVESYGSWTGRLGFLLQPSPYFQFRAHTSLTHHQEHFLTNSRTGRDVGDDLEQDPDSTVDLEGPDARLEKNPIFNPTFDGNGNRFRIKEYNVWQFFLTAAIKF